MQLKPCAGILMEFRISLLILFPSKLGAARIMSRRVEMRGNNFNSPLFKPDGVCLLVVDPQPDISVDATSLSVFDC
jgi:hypothetical protein